jgi:hypothetical protein
MPHVRARSCDLAVLLVAGAVWVAMGLCVNPPGNFPLNDDWIYAGAVQSIVAGTGFRIPGPMIANLIVQAYRGALFCVPFGFSYLALHVSTLVLGLVGLTFLYASMRELGGKMMSMCWPPGRCRDTTLSLSDRLSDGCRLVPQA